MHSREETLQNKKEGLLVKKKSPPAIQVFLWNTCTNSLHDKTPFGENWKTGSSWEIKGDERAT